MLVKQRLEALSKVFAQAAVGDFSVNLEMPSEYDEFTELYAGIQIMLEVIREKTAELEQLNRSLEEQVRQRTDQLEQRGQELERFNSLMVGRELKMTELKEELSRIKSEHNKTR